jgi:hypothetical protein
MISQSFVCFDEDFHYNKGVLIRQVISLDFDKKSLVEVNMDQ